MVRFLPSALVLCEMWRGMRGKLKYDVKNGDSARKSNRDCDLGLRSHKCWGQAPGSAPNTGWKAQGGVSGFAATSHALGLLSRGSCNAWEHHLATAYTCTRPRRRTCLSRGQANGVCTFRTKKMLAGVLGSISAHQGKLSREPGV